MTTRCQKRHYEDVAQLLAGLQLKRIRLIATAFADLFAADNPLSCSYCGTSPCRPGGVLPGHTYQGFDRKQFLAACGLEDEGDA